MRLYDEWSETAHLADLLNPKWHGLLGAMPGSTMSPEEVNGKLKVARRKFMEHRHFCRHCKEAIFGN
jgi:hypothetical protein